MKERTIKEVETEESSSTGELSTQQENDDFWKDATRRVCCDLRLLLSAFILHP